MNYELHEYLYMVFVICCRMLLLQILLLLAAVTSIHLAVTGSSTNFNEHGTGTTNQTSDTTDQLSSFPNGTSEDTDQTAMLTIRPPLLLKHHCPKKCDCYFKNLQTKPLLTTDCLFLKYTSFKNFTAFASMIDPQTVKLSVSCMTTPTLNIPANVFNHLSEIEDLTIFNCALTELPVGLFDYQQKLKKLYIFTRTAHLHIPKELFRRTNSLEHLGLNTFNELIIDTYALCKLEQLIYLNTWMCSIKSLRKLISGTNLNKRCLPALKKLDFSFNKLAEIDICLATSCCPDVKEIDMSSNILYHLADDTFSGLQLETLDLSNNSLSQITLDNMTVVHLNLSRNTLSDIRAIWSGSVLQTLDVSHNNLFLDVVRNLIQSTTHTFDQGTMRSEDSLLKDINFSGNNLHTLSAKMFVQHNHVVWLNLSDCGLVQVEVHALQGLSALKILDFSRNSLQSFDGLFEDTPELQQLHLADNSLVRFPFDINLPHLELLDLRHNKIANLHDKIVGVPKLKTLLLQDNIIEHIRYGVFLSLENLQLLRLDKNIIKEIDTYAFQGQQKLLTLNLNHNFLGEIGFMFGSHVKIVFTDIMQKENNNNATGYLKIGGPLFTPYRVSEIDLSENNITVVEPLAFTELPHINSVNLTHNNINFLPEEALATDQQTPRTVFYLKNNPLFCTCSTTFLKTINSDQSQKKGFIADVDLLSCSLLNDTKRLITEVEADEFLCEVDVDCDPLHCPCCSGQNDVEKQEQVDNKHCACSQRCPQNCSCIINQSRSLSIVNCSGNTYQQVPQEMPFSATVFDFSENQFSHLETADSFAGSVNARVLLLSKNHLSIIAINTFQHLGTLYNLDLSNNDLVKLNRSTFEGLLSLRVLNLSTNMLCFIANGTFGGLLTLKSLDLRANMLPQLNFAYILGMFVRPTAIWLSGNPWRCLCEDQHFKEELLTWAELIVDLVSMMCDVMDPRLIPANMTRSNSLALIETDFANCRKVVHKMSQEMRIGFISGGVVLLFILTAVFLTIRFQKHIQICLFAKYGVRFSWRKNSDNVFRRYDAFVVFSDNDRQFVLNELMPRLETEEMPYKLCIRLRDWLVGDSIADTILESIENSHRTILVLSDHFVEDEWRDYEFAAAHVRQVEDKANKHLIVLLIQDKPPENLNKALKMYIATNNYIKLSDPWCWKKLMFAMPKLMNETTARRRNEPTEIELAIRVQATEMEILNLRFHEGSLLVAEDQ